MDLEERVRWRKWEKEQKLAQAHADEALDELREKISKFERDVDWHNETLEAIRDELAEHKRLTATSDPHPEYVKKTDFNEQLEYFVAKRVAASQGKHVPTKSEFLGIPSEVT